MKVISVAEESKGNEVDAASELVHNAQSRELLSKGAIDWAKGNMKSWEQRMSLEMMEIEKLIQ
jgi:hypothetical protein